MTDFNLFQLAALANPQPNVALAALDPNDTSTAPADAHGSNKTVTWGQVGAAASADVARVMGFGHSYMSGFGNVEGGERYLTRLCASLHAEEVCYAVGGAILAFDQGGGNAGGYPTVLNALTPRTASAGAYSVRNAAPYMPLSPVVVFDYGYNDLQELGATAATNIAWWKMAQRACICLARAGGWFPDTDASVVYAAGWTANTGVTNFGWPTNHSTTTAASHLTITVPASFPGGEVDLLTLPFAGGTKWTAVVDGGAGQVLDGTSSAFGSSAGHSSLVVQRLTGLAAGTHSIVLTATTIDAGATAYFQGWLIASVQVPLTVMVNTPQVPSLPITGGPHTPLTGTDITSLNTAKTALAAEFTDGNVVVADIATAFANAGGNVAFTSPGSLYFTDNLHPSAAGHALIAQTVRDAIRSAPLPTAGRLAPMALLMRELGGPLEPALSAGWSLNSATQASGWFGKDRAGNTVLRATLKKSGAGVANEVIFTLPPGYQPSSVVLLGGISWASGYTSAGFSAIIVNTNGTVEWEFGDPTTELDYFATWPADGLGS